jgi:hypothetical protein
VRAFLFCGLLFSVARADVELPPAAVPQGEPYVDTEEYAVIAAAIDQHLMVTEKPRPLWKWAEPCRWPFRESKPPRGVERSAWLDAKAKPQARLDFARIGAVAPLRPVADIETGYTVSRVGFNTARTQALIWVDQHCRALCGNGSLLLMQKRASGWTVARILSVWDG